MRHERIIAEQEEWRRTYDAVGALLFENGVPPTPENFEYYHRCLAQGETPIVPDTALSFDDLDRMTADAQGFLDDISAIVTRSGEDARDYGAALGGEADLQASHLTVEKLVGLTRSMIDKARIAEDELRRTEAQVKALRDDLAAAQKVAHSDPLTGLPNRRAMDHHLRRALASARRSGAPLALAICDIDHFKTFNDTHGHQIGDEVIKFVGGSLAKAATADSFVARYGGEEFVMIFERTALPDAGKLLDKVRAAICARELKVTRSGQSLGRLSFSGGIAALDAHDSPGSILKRADAALYRAKEEGRNRVAIAD
ncbi:MAG: diguanylate cyclase [Rhizorhabdus sp.]|nr:diguanylate cyclase [Rhizorhabdus sp.]